METDRWTTARFAQAIYARFGVRYDPDHVGRIMHRLGLRERTRARKRVAEVVFATRFVNGVILPEASPTVA